MRALSQRADGQVSKSPRVAQHQLGHPLLSGRQRRQTGFDAVKHHSPITIAPAQHQPGPRVRLCRPAGAAPPRGGSAVREATSVGANKGRSAGPPQARPAPSGGSAVREATSVGANTPRSSKNRLERSSRWRRSGPRCRRRRGVGLGCLGARRPKWVRPSARLLLARRCAQTGSNGLR